MIRLLHHLLPFLVFGSLLSDAAKFLTAPFRGVEELAGNVWHAIRALFLKLRDVFGHVWSAFNDFYTGIVAFGRGAIHFARNVVNALGWLVESAIPDAAGWAWRKAFNFAKGLVHDLRSWAVKALDWLRRHAERLINAVEKLARHFYKLLRAAVLKVSHWTATFGTKLWNLVMHPSRLVTWIMPSLISPLLAWALRHSAPIVRFLFQAAKRDSIALAHVIEDVLAKLL